VITDPFYSFSKLYANNEIWTSPEELLLAIVEETLRKFVLGLM